MIDYAFSFCDSSQSNPDQGLTKRNSPGVSSTLSSVWTTIREIRIFRPKSTTRCVSELPRMSEHTNAGSVNLLPPTGVAVNIGLYLPTSTSPVEMVAIDNIGKRMNEEIFFFRKKLKKRIFHIPKGSKFFMEFNLAPWEFLNFKMRQNSNFLVCNNFSYSSILVCKTLELHPVNILLL